jgi:hypothetical protein
MAIPSINHLLARSDYLRKICSVARSRHLREHGVPDIFDRPDDTDHTNDTDDIEATEGEHRLLVAEVDRFTLDVLRAAHRVPSTPRELSSWFEALDFLLVRPPWPYVSLAIRMGLSELRSEQLARLLRVSEFSRSRLRDAKLYADHVTFREILSPPQNGIDVYNGARWATRIPFTCPDGADEGGRNVPEIAALLEYLCGASLLEGAPSEVLLQTLLVSCLACLSETSSGALHVLRHVAEASMSFDEGELGNMRHWDWKLSRLPQGEDWDFGLYLAVRRLYETECKISRRARARAVSAAMSGDWDSALPFMDVTMVSELLRAVATGRVATDSLLPLVRPVGGYVVQTYRARTRRGATPASEGIRGAWHRRHSDTAVITIPSLRRALERRVPYLLSLLDDARCGRRCGTSVTSCGVEGAGRLWLTGGLLTECLMDGDVKETIGAPTDINDDVAVGVSDEELPDIYTENISALRGFQLLCENEGRLRELSEAVALAMSKHRDSTSGAPRTPAQVRDLSQRCVEISVPGHRGPEWSCSVRCGQLDEVFDAPLPASRAAFDGDSLLITTSCAIALLTGNNVDVREPIEDAELSTSLTRQHLAGLQFLVRSDELPALRDRVLHHGVVDVTAAPLTLRVWCKAEESWRRILAAP